jgi:glycyl-tRNA synthetase beta chain
MFEAVKALGITVPTDFDARVQALRSFWALPEAQSLAAANKRVRNILRQAGLSPVGAIDPARFAHAAETTLHQALLALPSGGDYGAQLSALETLRAPVDAFFDMRTPAGEPVMVNDPDAAIRANRLALLAALDVRCREVADISLLPG